MQAPVESKIPKSRLPLEWTDPKAGLMLAGMGQANQIANCPGCGRAMKLAFGPVAGACHGLQCGACDKFDPLKSELVTGWLNGELGRPTRTVIQPE